MWRLYQTVITHRTMLKAVVMALVIATMALGISGDAAADEGFDP